MSWKDNMGSDRAGLLAEARPREAREHLAEAREALARADFNVARVLYLKSVESWRQANELTRGAYQVAWEETTKEYEHFVLVDPLYQRVIEAVEPVILNNPGILQTELYTRFPQIPRSDISYVLYFAAKQERIIRKKKGRTYEIHSGG